MTPKRHISHQILELIQRGRKRRKGIEKRVGGKGGRRERGRRKSEQGGRVEKEEGRRGRGKG